MTKMTRNSLGRIWRWPLILAGLIIFGLLSALIGQGGAWWAVSWAALAAPLVLLAAHTVRSMIS